MPVPLDQLIPFLAGSILINVVPGADMALIMRQVFLGGTRLAYRTIAGNMSGILVHTAALAVGLSALLVASATAYTVVKIAGAMYLIFLGAQSLLGVWRSRRETGAAATGDGAPGQTTNAGPARRIPSMRTAYLQGLIST